MSTIEQVWNPTSEEYHAERNHVSRSALEIFRRSRRLYHGIFVTGELPKPEPSDAMVFGTCSHMAILEPGRLEREVVTIPDSVLSANGSRAGSAWKAFVAENAGKCLLKQAEYGAVQRVADAVLEHDYVRAILESGPLFEHCVTWQDHETGLLCKSLRDVVAGSIIADIKTCPDPSPKGFAKSAANFGYARQAAFYLEGHRMNGHAEPRFVFIAVGKEPPHEVGCYELDIDDMRRGERQNRAAMFDLADAIENDAWTDEWAVGVNLLKLPKYAAYEDDWRI